MALENKYILENFDQEVLREYDIRGIVGNNINENTAYTIGRTFGYFVKLNFTECNIIAGYDGRLTSPKLHNALCEGLKNAGTNVIDVGMGPTPMIYFAHHHIESQAAVMVTGSHNPSEYNGFKLVLNKHSFYSDEIQKLQEYLISGDLKIKEGCINKHNVVNEYVNRNLQNIKIKNNLKIAWDVANGAMGKVIKEFTSRLENTDF